MVLISMMAMLYTGAMPAITIRQVDEDTKRRLRLRAAANGRSMEAEAREILRATLSAPHRVDLTWIDALHQAAVEVGGVDLDLPDDTAATAADFHTATGPADVR